MRKNKTREQIKEYWTEERLKRHKDQGLAKLLRAIKEGTEMKNKQETIAHHIDVSKLRASVAEVSRLLDKAYNKLGNISELFWEDGGKTGRSEKEISDDCQDFYADSDILDDIESELDDLEEEALMAKSEQAFYSCVDDISLLKNKILNFMQTR